MLLSERIKSLASGDSVHFRLVLQFADGSSRIFPPEDGAFFRVGDAPHGIANGHYYLSFYDAEYRPIAHPKHLIEINLQSEVQQQRQGQLSLHFQNARGSAPAPAAPEAPRAQVQEPTRADSPTAARTEAPQSSASQDEADLELRRHLHAMDLEERQQEFIKNSAYVTEVGELFALNRIMRREMLELQRIIVQHSQQSYKDIHHVKGTVHELLALQQAVLEHAAKQLAAPPAPPPDYVGLGHSALAVVKEIGVALIQRAPKAQSAELRSKSGSPQLTAPAAVVDASPAPQRPDVIERLMKKLQGMTEADVALAMSSPDTWKTLFDELRAPPSTEKPGESATSSKVE